MKIPMPTQGEFEPAPAGNHIAVCYGVLDLGTQDSPMYGAKHQVAIRWELSDEKMEDGQPFTVVKYYSWSMHEKATLRQHLESWRGCPFSPEEFGKFDIRAVIGTTCMVQVAHTEAGKAKVVAVGAKPKGVQPRNQINPTEYVSLDPAEFDRSAYDKLSEYWAGVIAQSPEYRALQGEAGKAGEAAEPAASQAVEYGADDVPF